LYNPWLALSFKIAQLGWDVQSVMALRLLRLAGGGARGQAEASRMAAEKIAAVAAAVITGRKNHVIAGKGLGVFRKLVRANKRRLSRR
jgi:patatin-like phospholipase/acyl hydrolase